MIDEEERYETRMMKLYCPHCKKWFLVKLHIDKGLGDVICKYAGDGEPKGGEE